MEEKKVQTQPKKLSYEELENVAKQLSEQLNTVVAANKQLEMRLRQVNMDNIFTQLQFRMEIAKNKELFSDEFNVFNIKTIESILTPQEQEEPTKK